MTSTRIQGNVEDTEDYVRPWRQNRVVNDVIGGIRQVLIWGITLFVYLPFIGLGRVLKPLGLEKQVPLYEFYNGKTIGRIRQDAHDRFATAIEHRYSKDQILELRDTFSKVDVSDRIPYWHFLCTR